MTIRSPRSPIREDGESDGDPEGYGRDNGSSEDGAARGTTGLDRSRDDDQQFPELQSPVDLPYLARRQLKNKCVKADREEVLFFLREGTQASERDLRRAVEEELCQEVKKTNLREAAYVFAQRNPEGVADVLREWGVEYLT